MSLNPRLVVGKRSNGDIGVFASPPGVNAFTAADSSLVMNISSKISQLILLGNISSSQTISLGLGQQPIVLLTTYNTFSFIGTTRNGPIRPSPVGTGQPSASVTINSGGSSMTISTSVKVAYAVYSKAF